MYYACVYPHLGDVEMPQIQPIQQSLFPELPGTFQGSESLTKLNQEARHGSQRRHRPEGQSGVRREREGASRQEGDCEEPKPAARPTATKKAKAT